MPDMNENAETQQEYFGKAKLETDYKDLSMRLYKRIADLEKENAELKKKNLATQDAVTMQMYTNKANKEIADRQLTKAKELLRKFMKFYERIARECYSKDFQKTLTEAEQFLNSEVEK